MIVNGIYDRTRCVAVEQRDIRIEVVKEGRWFWRYFVWEDYRIAASSTYGMPTVRLAKWLAERAAARHLASGFVEPERIRYRWPS